MGLKEMMANAPMSAFGPFALYADRVKQTKGFVGEEHPLVDVRASVERGSDLEARVTMTRLVALGIFAFAAKKKSGGELYLTVEGPDFFWSQEVDRKKASQATKFASRVNDQARKVAADG